MPEDEQIKLLQHAKEILCVDGECSIFELHERLRAFRNDTHPDKFQDEQLKKDAEARFKDVQSLLDEFDKLVQLDRFKRKSSELAVYKPLYDTVQLSSDLDKAKTEIEGLKTELKNEKELTDDLKKQLVKKEDESLKNEIEHLKSLYKASPQKYATLGLGVVLTGALLVMSRIEAVWQELTKYSPFSEKNTKLYLFIIFLTFLGVTLRKLWEHGYIKWKSEAICSPRCAATFMDYLKQFRGANAPICEFSESESFSYIKGQNGILKRCCRLLGFKIHREDTIAQLNNIFLQNLLNKRLIEISNAEDFQRHFTILSKRNNYELYYQYRKAEEEKKPSPKSN
jgi:hypothetical protein